jgi:hypothetical protein
MNNKQKSYADRIRGMAEDIDCAQVMVEYDFIAKKLRELADELEEELAQEPSKET